MEEILTRDNGIKIGTPEYFRWINGKSKATCLMKDTSMFNYRESIFGMQLDSSLTREYQYLKNIRESLNPIAYCLNEDLKRPILLNVQVATFDRNMLLMAIGDLRNCGLEIYLVDPQIVEMCKKQKSPDFAKEIRNSRLRRNSCYKSH